MGNLLRPAESRLSTILAAPADGELSPTASAPPLAGFDPASLKVLHILRAPLGGLFRHLLDVAHGQSQRGHRVGLIVDRTTGGARAEAILADLTPSLALGLERVAITRELGPSDLPAVRLISRRIKRLAPDVLHGHGAKGAALARLVLSAPHAIRVYTPHGGSLVYRPGTFIGDFYRSLEWLLKWRTDLFLFESTYATSLFRALLSATWHDVDNYIKLNVLRHIFGVTLPRKSQMGSAWET
jgi:Glycosyltransferase Family 4